ncbi:MAG TPA: hypothetical protein VGG69_06645 [Rhizomicrobium sp.]
MLTPGAHNYWKSHDFKLFTDAAGDLLLDDVRRLPTSKCEVLVGHLGGQVNRVPTDATAFPRRDVEFVVNVHTRWGDQAQDTICIDWAHNLFQSLAPHAMGAV